MEPPIPLTGEARKFWDRHSQRLSDRGILKGEDLDAFAVLALTWAKLAAISVTPPGADNYREMIQFTNLNKQFQALAKQFGMLPRERRVAKMDGEATPDTDDFGLPVTS